VTAALVVDALTVELGGRRILEDVSFSIGPGTFVALLGSSGAGKSTLLGALCGRLDPVCGDVRVVGRGGAEAGFVPQLPLEDRSPFSIEEIVTLAGPRLGLRTRRHEQAQARVVLERLGLDGLLERRLSELSGGQRQRVAIAAAAYLGSPVLLCDEPTSGADPVLAADVLGLLREIADQGNIVIVSSHDVVRLRSTADRVLGLRDGRLVLDKNAVDVTDADVDGVYTRTGGTV
jgi:zinc/manganese transport system ATP-binding protein